MKRLTFCTKCETEWEIKKIEKEESTIERKGKKEKVVVQFFRCPNCGEKYIICVFNDELYQISEGYKNFLKERPQSMTKKQFVAQDRKWKNRLNAEASMLLHCYNKQKKAKMR